MQPQDPVSTSGNDSNEQQPPDWHFLTRAGKGEPPTPTTATTTPPETTPTTATTPEEQRNKEYKEQLQQLAQQTSYFILLQDTTSGQKIPDPEDVYRRKTVVFYGNEWEEVEFKRYKITITDHQRAEELYSRYEEFDYEEDDTGGKMDAAMEYYQFLASCYLKMTEDEFKRADWGYLKLVMDACQYRTTRTLPKISRALYEYYHLGKAKLNDDEYECLRMYRLWTGKAKTKPWEYNGGIVYQEDLNTVLEMEELEISGNNFRAKKQQAEQRAKEGGGSVGEDGVLHKRTTKIKNR
ncbi:MAG: hypothetical protein ICV68_18280 [Pyrinomonadaceae bacterium]|nr:hypothetical protein [Pyrinomonadaceae bacterium]